MSVGAFITGPSIGASNSGMQNDLIDIVRAHPYIGSSYNDTQYEIREVLGQGGFGIAFAARDCSSGEEVCVKLTEDQESWHQEAYFGSLLRGNRRVIQLIESFPYLTQFGDHQIPLYALVFEYAKNGHLGDYLVDRGPWEEARARREACALLKVLTELHAGGAMHRDITPMNVLVTGRGALKLTDFGIARQRLLGKEVPADCFNLGFVSYIKQNAGRRHWLMSDDVFQMGQLLAMIIRGDPTELVGQRALKKLECSDEVKKIISKAIGPRKDRYESAYEMMLALEGQDVEAPKVRTLSRKRVVFTGALTLKREDAALLVSQAGGVVQDSVHGNTHVVVVGQRSKLYQSKFKGKKLLAAQKLNKRGSNIRFINEPQFMKLVRL